MFNQKLYKNGNSIAVTIPKQYLNELNLRDGSSIIVKKRGQEIVVTPKKPKLAREVNVEFAKTVDEFLDEHSDVLKELAKR